MESTINTAFDRPLAVGSLIYNMVSQFYTREAWLLDHHRLPEWMQLLAEDVRYKVPLRVTETREAGDQVSRRNWHYNDDLQAIGARIHRVVSTKSAWSDDPQVRIRRFITNIAIGESDKPDEFEVMSYIMVARNRFEAETYQFVTAERHDLLRRVDESFKIARREVILDLSVLGSPNIAFFF